jgi:predicted esterase
MRWLAIVVVLASASASAENRRKPPTCADAIVFALVGSGQHVTSATDLSVSPQLAAIYAGAVSALEPAHTIAPRVIEYPAESTRVLWAGVTVWNFETKLRSNLGRYLAGEQAGLNALRGEVALARARCPRSKLALIGYSQGAMIVHQFLNELARVSDATAIAAAVVLADPERVAGAAPIELGTATAASDGVCSAASHVASCTAPEPLEDIREPYAHVTASLCDAGDAVCDTSEMLRSIAHDVVRAKQLARDGMAIHSAYASKPATVDAGRWLARQLF